MQLKVFKYEAAGNDFAAIDDRHGNLPQGHRFSNAVQALCNRRTGVGADGVLVLLPSDSPGTDFRMKYYNRDGSTGEMCGNGARSIARFARLMGMAEDEMTFQTDAGVYKAWLVDEDVRLSFPPISILPRQLSLKALGLTWDADYIEAGVPHLVVWTDDLEHADVEAWGRSLRHHEEFEPRGTNVNFAQPAGRNAVRIRTYERGVEEETLACGTGSVASAICHAARRNVSGANRVQVTPTSGKSLTIGFDLGPQTVDEITLTGPARLVFTTVVEWDEETAQLAPFDFQHGIRGALKA